MKIINDFNVGDFVQVNCDSGLLKWISYGILKEKHDNHLVYIKIDDIKAGISNDIGSRYCLYRSCNYSLVTDEKTILRLNKLITFQ
jgi:hypothetical protein